MASGGRDAELTELTRLSNNVYAFVDSEREAEGGSAAERRLEFAKTCERIAIRAYLSQFRAIENYFTERAVKAAFGDQFSALGEFGTLKGNPRGWRKADNWKIARQMQLAELTGTDLGSLLEEL